MREEAMKQALAWRKGPKIIIRLQPEIIFISWTIDSQSVVLAPAASAAPGKRLEIKNSRALSQTYWIRICRSGAQCFNKPSKAMAPHSSTLAWKIPWTEEPGGLQSMGLLRVRHDWATSLSLFTCMHWRRKWQPTPVFLPGESQGWGSLVGCRLWGRTESDMTEAT